MNIDRRQIRSTQFFFGMLFFGLATGYGSLLCETFVGKKIVFIEPVTDMDTVILLEETQKQIAVSLPACPDTQKCFRAYQALYNELATCVAEQEGYIEVAFDAVVYGFDKNSQKPLNTFWVKKNKVLFLDSISDDKIEQAIPAGEYAGKPTIVLIYPWNVFSAGTRFFHKSEQDKRESYCVRYFDYKKENLVTAYIPKKYALKEMPLQGEYLVRLRFVTLINNLVDMVAESSNNTQIIPYVWGGSSFIQSHQKDESNFYVQDGVWHRHRNKQKNKKNDNQQYTGYDCSGFIMRMAKIAGVDFPWKTSWAIQEKKKALGRKDILKNGDIIWIPGHVMVVSNIANNELIEARGYGSGFGCIHKIKISEFFDGIDTYQDLLEAYHTKKKIKYKNKNGVVGDKECEFKLLKLID